MAAHDMSTVSLPASGHAVGAMPSLQATLVSVIITHYNYSGHVEGAIRSVLQQTHSRFECIVVDDCSSPPHREALREIIARCADPRVTLIELPVNKGQITALFEGLAAARGEYVALLDPDDLYEPQFIEKLLRCHLNPVVYAPIAFCDMGLFRMGGDVLTRTYTGFKYRNIRNGTMARAEATMLDFGFSAYYPAETRGWIWATTSSMMYRRDALKLLVRADYDSSLKFYADAYCAFGAHFVGGTLYLDEVLSWRGPHADNTAENTHVLSNFQFRQRRGFEHLTKEMKLFSIETLIANRADTYFGKNRFEEVLLKQCDGPDIQKLRRKYPHLDELLNRERQDYE